MGSRSLILIAVAACGGGSTTGPTPPTGTKPAGSLREKVVADFEAAVKQSKDAYLGLFDFVAVGEYEILLHRYDLLGRLKNLTDAEREQFFAEDGTPYSAERERRNVGSFYKILGQRTVGTGDCKPVEPRTQYAKQLGTFEPLPARTEAFVVGAMRSQSTPTGYYVLRDHAIQWLAKGGVVSIACYGGNGGLALVYTEKPNARGYDLITIYDD